MTDSMKVLIGFSCIWGVFVLVGMLFSAFTMGANDPDALRLALFLYAFTFLPLSLLAIRHRKAAALALLALALITSLGFIEAAITNRHADAVNYTSVGDRIFTLVFIGIPALVATLLLRHKETC